MHERIEREQGGSRPAPSRAASRTPGEQGIVAGRSLSPALLLGLQRAVGNRTVLQRLLYNQNHGIVMGPEAYADRALPWNEERGIKEADRPPTALKDLVKQRNAKGHLASGFGVKASDLVDIKGVKDDALQKGAAGLLTKETPDEAAAVKQARAGALDELGVVARHDRRLLEFRGQEVKFGTAEQVRAAARWVMPPEDMLPGKPDLLPKGTNVLTATAADGKAYWEYMCVLIALFKATGGAAAPKVKALTTKDCGGDLDKSVQALHDYYVGQDIQFDDSSARTAIMKDWGFTLVFSGNCGWMDLAAQMALDPKKVYIFDTDDHAVYVKIRKPIAKGTPGVKDANEWYDPQSDKRNYTPKHEFLHNVLRIWQKAS